MNKKASDNRRSYLDVLDDTAKFITSSGCKAKTEFSQDGFDKELNCRKYVLEVRPRDLQEKISIKKLLSDQNIVCEPDDNDPKVLIVFPNFSFQLKEVVRVKTQILTTEIKPVDFLPKKSVSKRVGKGSFYETSTISRRKSEITSEKVYVPRMTVDICVSQSIVDHPKPVVEIKRSLYLCENLDEELGFLGVEFRRSSFHQGGTKIKRRYGKEEDGVFYYICRSEHVEDFTNFLISIGYTSTSFEVVTSILLGKNVVPVVLYLNNRPIKIKEDDDED